MSTISVAQAVVLPQFRAVEISNRFYIQMLCYDNRHLANNWYYKFLVDGQFNLNKYLSSDIDSAIWFKTYGEAVEYLNVLYGESSKID